MANNLSYSRMSVLEDMTDLCYKAMHACNKDRHIFYDPALVNFSSIRNDLVSPIHFPFA